MTPSVRKIQNIEKFFNAIAYKEDGYLTGTFSYIAEKVGSEFLIRQCKILLHTVGPQSPLTHFHSEHIRAGCYALSELQLNARDLVQRLISGPFPTPHGEMRFSPNEGNSFSAAYDPLSKVVQSTQCRYDILTILGGAAQPQTLQPLLDWELKASPTPYDTLQELAFE